MNARNDENRRVLIEDEDGAPYPVCSRCSDQVVPPEDHGRSTDWMHVHASPATGHRTYLHNCQRPNEGRYGTAENRATPPMDKGQHGD